MARLTKTQCDGCPHQGDKEACDNGTCHEVSNVRLSDDGQYVVWSEDLDTVVIGREDLKVLANALGYDLVPAS